MDPWGWIDRTSYEFFGFVLVEYVVRGNRRVDRAGHGVKLCGN